MKNNISFLNSYGSLEEALKEMGVSKNQMKKSLSSKERHIIVSPQKAYRVPLNLLNYLRINPDYSGPQVKVLDSDDRFIVLNKPSGAHSHPLDYEGSENCLSYLRSIGESDALTVNSESYDRGLLFRLDYETSGVLIYCKDEHLFKHLREDFQKVFKKKIYLCLVRGSYKGKPVISTHLVPSGKKGEVMKVSDQWVEGCFKAHIKVKKIHYSAETDLTLLRVTLGEGVRHQIRALMQYEGYPILGDQLYGDRPAGRLYLHSFYYQLNYADQVKSWKSMEIDDFYIRLGADSRSYISKSLLKHA